MSNRQASRRPGLAVAIAAALLSCASVAPRAGAADVPALMYDPAPIGPVRKPHVLPRRTPSLVIAPQATLTTGMLTYYGGPVMSNVQVIQVLWGTGSYFPQVANTVSPNLQTFYTNVLASPYVDWLTEYNTTSTAYPTRSNQQVGRGQFLGTVTITPSAANNGSIIDDTQVQAELVSQIRARALPAPNANTYYAVFFPAGKTISQGTPVTYSCRTGGFCAYHGTVQSGATTFAYGVEPDFGAGSGCDTGCGTGTQFSNVTSVASHEVVETITDPDVGLATSYAPPLAWYNSLKGEIGDLCNQQQASLVGSDGVTYTVQTEYSNSLGNCIVTNPAIAGPDFSVSVAPGSVSVQPGGGAATASVTLAVVRGSPLPASLAVIGLPAGVTAAFANPVVTGNGTTTLSITSAPGTAGGVFPVTVTGSSGSLQHSANVTLTVVGSYGDGDVPTLPEWAALLLGSGLLLAALQRQAGRA